MGEETTSLIEFCAITPRESGEPVVPHDAKIIGRGSSFDGRRAGVWITTPLEKKPTPIKTWACN